MVPVMLDDDLDTVALDAIVLKPKAPGRVALDPVALDIVIFGATAPQAIASDLIAGVSWNKGVC